jgi:hypothetical protein
MALAKRGDVGRQKEIVCNILAARPGVASELEYIGGWFAIRAAFLLLDQEKPYWEWKKRAKPSDVKVRGSPRSWALKALRGIVKEPPNGMAISDDSSPDELTSAEAAWRTWLKKNSKEAAQWKPRGGVFPKTLSECQ